jgi:hypothetical protein
VTLATPEAIITVYLHDVAIATSTVASGSEDVAAVTLREVINRDWASTYAPVFAAQLATAAPTPLTPAATQELAATTRAVGLRLAQYEQELYGRELTAMNSGSLHPAGVELAGAKKLLDSFITLGFPQAVERDDLLRSLLFSDQRLVDDAQISVGYLTRSTEIQVARAAGSDMQLTLNPRLTLRAAEQKRLAALGELLARYLVRISAGTYREDSTLVAEARLDLRMARRIASASDSPSPSPSPSPSRSLRVFLPLVRS